MLDSKKVQILRRWSIGQQTLRERYVSSTNYLHVKYATLTIVFHLLFHFVLGISFVFFWVSILYFFLPISNFPYLAIFGHNYVVIGGLVLQPYEHSCSCFLHTEPRSRRNYVISFRSYFWMLFSTCWETKAMRFNIMASTVACILLRTFYYTLETLHPKTIAALLQEVFFSFPTPFWSLKILIHPLILFILFQCFIQIVCFLQWMLRLAIEQPSFIQENRLLMRTSQIACYASEQEACLLNRQASSNLFNLSSANQSFPLSFSKYKSFSVSTHSSWYVACFPNLVSIPPDCHTNHYANNLFNTLEVQINEPSWNVWYPIPFPLNSEVIPFPTNKSQNTTFSYLYEKINPPLYTNIPYPFICNPPFISSTLLSAFNHQHGSPFTCYLCSFKTPWTLANENSLPVVSLIIQGCGPAFYVFLNGNYIGYSTDTFLSSEFLVSSHLNWTRQKNHTTPSSQNIPLQGTLKAPLESTSRAPLENTSRASLESGDNNTLLLVVPRWCAASYLEDQDHWWFSGCFRDVELMRWPLQEKSPSCVPRESQLYKISDPSKCPSSTSLKDPTPTKLCIEDFSVCTRLMKSDAVSNFSKGSIHITLWLATELMKKEKCYLDEKISHPTLNETIFSTTGLSNFGVQVRLFFCGCPARKEPGTGDLKLLDTKDVPPLDFSSYCIEDLNVEWDFVKNSKQVAFLPATPFSLNSIMVKSFTNFSTHLELIVNNPMLWCDESPYVYMICISLVDLNSSPKAAPLLQCEATLIGFTRVSFHSSQLCINDRPCLLKGVNRHEHHPFYGKHTSNATILDDLLLIKQSNFNAIRTSHYPNTPFFYFLCTLLGIYVVDEANIETHGDVLFAWNRFLSFLTVRLPLYPICRLANDPDWKLPWLSRISRMVLRDASHPCIILWSTGNEAGAGAWPREAKKMLTKFSETLQYRPVQYEPGHSPSDSSDIFCPMYMPFKQIQNYALSLAASKEKKKCFQCIPRPLILCEYQHAMGNSNGDLDKYWEAFDTYPLLQGGFIWDFADQGLLQSRVLDDQYKVYHWAYGGDFANDTIDKNFNHNGLLYADRRLKPGIIEAKYVQQPIIITFHSVTCFETISHSFKQNQTCNAHERSSSKTIHITLKVLNKQIYNDLKYFQCHYSLTSFYYSSLERTGILSFPDPCEPSTSTFISLNVPNLPNALLKKQLSLVVHVTLNKTFLWAKKGHSVARCQIIINLPACLPQVHFFLCSRKIAQLLYFPLPAKHPLLWHSCHLNCNFTPKIALGESDHFWFVRRLFIQDLKHSCCSHTNNIKVWCLEPFEIKLKTAQPLKHATSFSMTSFLFTTLATPFNVYEIFNSNNVSIFIHCETGVIEGLAIQHPYPSSISTLSHSSTKSLTKPFNSFHSFLYGPIHYNFTRASTDNDRGGLDICLSPFTMLRTSGILGALWGAAYYFTNPNQNVKSYESCWRKAGLYEMEPSLVDFKVFFNDSTPLHKTCLQLQLIQNHTPKCNTLQKTTLFNFFSSKIAQYLPNSSHFQTKTTYTFYYTGLCQIHSLITPLHAFLKLQLPSLPRIGLSLCLPSWYQDVAYCGLGPHENYIDRKASAIMGVFKSTVDAMYEPYTVPCENGNRGNVQWISLMQPCNSTDQYLYGILVLKNEKNDPGLECSVQPFSIKQLTHAKHPSDLGVSFKPRRPYALDKDKSNHLGSNQDMTHQTCNTLFYSKEKYRKLHLHIDAKQMGVGGECSWLPCLDDHSSITFKKQHEPNHAQIPPFSLVPIYRCQQKKKFDIQSMLINKI